MKFKYNLPTFIFVAFVALSVAEVATIAYYICKMCGFFNLESKSLPLEITTTIVCCLALAFSIFMLSLHYKLTDTHFQLKFGFFDLFNKRIQTSNILNVVIKNKSKVYLSYITNTPDPIIVFMAIDKDNIEKFTNTLKALNNKILITEE